MQRIGRVNRIGSTAAAIHIFNFYPTAQVDSDIDLHRKAFLKLQAFHSALGEDSQVYSPEEEVTNFGLFDRDVEEDRDERLAFLSELRDFKDAHPDDFRRIRHLPLRARCGRADASQSGQSLVFIRDQRRDAFYRAAEKDRLTELSFVEMAKAFRAEVSELSAPLPENHHGHIRASLGDFSAKLASDAVRERAVDQTVGPNEQRALRILAAAQGMPSIDAREKAELVAAQHAIRVAKFQDLPRKLNAFQKAVEKKHVSTAAYLDKLLEIVRTYPLDVADENGAATSSPGLPPPASGLPEIILSESFVANSP